METNSEISTIYQCRICLEEEETIDNLISPCRCSGTSKYVHVECLERWRYQDVNAPGFYKCMECNENYIILNNDEIEDENLFYIFYKPSNVFYFQLTFSIPLTLFFLIIDSYTNTYKLVEIFPSWYDNKLLNLVKSDSFYENLFYGNISIYIQNLIFIIIYILRSLLFVKNKKKLFKRMINNIFLRFVYYNFAWIILIALLSFNLYEFAIFSLFVYQILSFKINHLLIENHYVAILNINSELSTGVASMEANPFDIVIDENDSESELDLNEDNIELLGH